MKLRKIAPIAGLAAATFALTACTGGSYGDNTAEKAAPQAPAATASAEAAAPAAGAEAADPAAKPKKQQVLTVAQLDGFSPVVTNQKGRTIYRFDKDSNSPATSTCFDACAKTWEPVLVGSDLKIADPSIRKDLIGTIDRPEGKQVTLKGWPLYYFKTDLKLGQTAGQGKGGTWFAIAPDGAKAKQSKTGGAATSSGGYSY